MQRAMRGPRALLLAALSAGAASLACSCSTSAKSTPAATCSAGAHDQALAAVSDYTSSGVGGFALDDTGYMSLGVELYKDPEIETSAGRAFFIARDVGLIYELDPHCGVPTGSRLDANDPGETDQSDPQDVAVAADGTLWVPRYLRPSVAVLTPSGDFADTIDLTKDEPDGTPYDPDGNPNASAIAIADVDGGSKAFVALERLDDTQVPYPLPYPSVPSQILRIDVASRKIEAAIDLLGRNPFGLFTSFGGYLWLAEPGDVDTANEPNAGIERFDPQTSTSVLLLAESALGGGSVMEVAVTAGCGAAIVADPSPKNLTALVTFSPDTGQALTTYASPAYGPTTDFDLQGMLWVGSALLLGDRTTTASGSQYAVHVFDASSDCVLHQRTPDAIFLPLPPIAFRAAAP